MVATFVGTAHPPPGSKRNEPGELNAAEIATLDMGSVGRQRVQAPVLVEHNGPPVGRVLASWTGRKGEMRVLGRIDDAEAEVAVRNGEMRGLSLATEMHYMDSDREQRGDATVRKAYELSVCEMPKRARCFIDEIDGKRVPTACYASAKGATTPASASRPFSPPSPLSLLTSTCSHTVHPTPLSRTL
jgi:hypothetical protein